MTFLSALFLGCVEGITEFLPISSTAHLLLVQKLLNIPLTESVKSFDIAIQLGAIGAVVLLSGKRLLIERRTLFLVFCAFMPTAIIGLVLHDFVISTLFENTSGMLVALILGGIVMIVVEQRKKQGTKEQLTWKDAVLIGIIQSVAMMPGVSRSGATIIAALLLGVTRKEAVEFSFLIAIPTMAAATGLDLLKNPQVVSGDSLSLILIGFTAAFITAFFAIRWLRHFITTHTFTPFGIYRIVLALALFWIFS